MRRLLAALIALSLAWPASAAAPLTRIAFGSCADEERPQPIWDAVLAYKPELFIFAGDNVYGDVWNGRRVPEDQLMARLREAYQAAGTIPGFVNLRASVPHLATWDDHDYGKNDAGVEFDEKREAQQLFVDFWRIPEGDQRRSRDGIYHAQSFGPPGMRVQVILLDTRFFRSPLRPTDVRNAPGRERYLPDDDPGKTMLGEAQWRWLANQLEEPAELRLIVSSIQVLAEGHGWERWGNLPRERKRLFDLIGTTRAKGVLFLSGDRHVGGLYREAEGTPYPLVEITSSGLTQTFPGNREAGPNRLGAVYGAENFGTVDIDWPTKTVTLSVRSMDGDAVRRHVVALEELRP